MRRFLKRALVGTAAFGAASYGVTYYMFPEIRKNQEQLLKATQRMLRLSVTGMHMAYIYGIKNNTWHEKHVEASKLLFEAFKENGGIYIKIGQILATLDILAPDEYVAQLSLLYQSAKPSPFETVRSQIEETLGKKLEDIFESFNPVPISAASIGQVHEAYLKNGQKVAVKVQHKWLKEQCQGDIKVVDALIGIGEFLFPDFKYKWFGDELRKYVPSELDFEREVTNAEKTRYLFRKQPNIRVPHMYHELSNDKVIVMEFVPGVSIDKIQQIRNMGLNLKEVAKLLSHCFSRQIFKYGHVHADPHPGNLFISAEEDSNGVKRPVLTLLDHGLYQPLNDQVRLQYSYLWKGILTRDEEMIKQAATDLGVGDWYPLLAAMISRKSFADLMEGGEQDYNKRLKASHTQEEKERLQTYAKNYSKEITIVLHEINKDVLLLFKTNDFLTSITNRLGDPVNKYEILARYCLEEIEHQELKNKDTLASRFRLFWTKTSTLLGLRLYALYFSVLSFFRPSQLPDEILLEN